VLVKTWADHMPRQVKSAVFVLWNGALVVRQNSARLVKLRKHMECTRKLSEVALSLHSLESASTAEYRAA
jgi:hypothetical protein